jgi:hypothetical protein
MTLPGHRLSTVDRALLAVILAVTFVIVALLIRHMPPPNRARANHWRVVGLLMQAQPVFAPMTPHQITAVMLRGGPTLVPERQQVFDGYTLVAHVRDESFTVGAMPVAFGKSGLASLFRDEHGAIRIEMRPGRPADANSRPFDVQPAPDANRPGVE